MISQEFQNVTFYLPDIIKVRQGEIRRLESEAVTLRSQADTACYQGTTRRQYGLESRKLLEEGSKALTSDFSGRNYNNLFS